MNMRIILAVLAMSWPCTASPESSPPAEPGLMELARRTREARLAGDNQGWLEHGQATLAQAPDHPDLLISTARAYAANGRANEALDLLGQAIRRGARVDAALLPEFEALEGDARFAPLAAQGRLNLRPAAPPEVFLVIEDGSIDTEGIAYDEDTARLFIGSLKGGIWQVDLRGNVEPFAGAESGLREVVGLKVDRKRRLLWAATGVFPDLFGGEPKKHAGLTGVIAFNIDSGERAGECWLDERPILHGFNDLALAENGDVYVSDSATGSVYRLPGGGCRLERIIQDPRMSFPNGIALSKDEARLYVAHIEGLSVVDLATGRRTALAVPGNTSVNSIDGLVRDGADLIGIQPSPYLARVLRIRLDDAGYAIREVVTVSSPPPEGLSPTTGVIVGSQYFSVAGVVAPPGTSGGQDRRARILRATLR
jgi:sugar lactone lactonase YvrE